MSVDRYYTPPHVAKAMNDLAVPGPGDVVLEPSAADGRLLVNAFDIGARLVAFDLEPLHPMVLRADFLTVEPQSVDLAIMNPPYKNSLDLKFVERALEWAPVVVVLLRDCTSGLKGWHKRIWSKHTVTDRIYCGRLLFDGPDAVAKKGKAKGKRVNSHHSFMIVRIVRGTNLLTTMQLPVERWLWDIEQRREEEAA